MSWRVSRATVCTGERLPEGAQGDAGGPVRPREPECQAAQREAAAEQVDQCDEERRKPQLNKGPAGMENGWTRGDLVREGRKIHRKLFQFLKNTLAHLHLHIYLPVILCQDSHPS